MSSERATQRDTASSNTKQCGACGEDATHEVQPPNPERDDWVPVCETHMKELRPISGDTREVTAR